MAVSPDISNYYIGKGNVYFRPDGETEWRHVGNVPEFEFTPEIENLEHFSSMAGTRSKDRTVVIEKSGTLRVLMEEWTIENLSMALLGDVQTDSEGQYIDIFSSNAISGAVRFEGQNEVGPTIELIFNRVDFIPGSSINPISDEWGQLEITGEVAAVNGSFGTARILAEEAA